MRTIASFISILILCGGIASAADGLPQAEALRVTVGQTHFWNRVTHPAREARQESFWSFSHAFEFTVPENYQPGMTFLLYTVIDEGEYLRSESFSLIDAEGKEIAHEQEKGMPFTYSATYSSCTFKEALASLSTRQYRRYASHTAQWVPGQRFRVRFGFSRQVPFDAKVMVAFVNSKESATNVDYMMPAAGMTEYPIFGEWLGNVGLRGLRLIQNEHRLIHEEKEKEVRGFYRTCAVSNGPLYPTVADGCSPWGWTVDKDENASPPIYTRIPPNPKATPAGVEAILGKPDLILPGSTYEKATRYPKTDCMLSDLSERWMYFYDLVAMITAPGQKDGPFEWMRVGCGPMMPLRYLPEKGYGFTRLGDTNAYGFFKDRELKTVITRFGRRPKNAEVIGEDLAKADYTNYDSKRRLATLLTYQGEAKWEWTSTAPDGVSVEVRKLQNHKFEGHSEIRGRDKELIGEACWKNGLAEGKAWWTKADGKRREEDYRVGRMGHLVGSNFYFENSSLLAVPE